MGLFVGVHGQLIVGSEGSHSTGGTVKFAIGAKDGDGESAVDASGRLAHPGVGVGAGGGGADLWVIEAAGPAKPEAPFAPALPAAPELPGDGSSAKFPLAAVCPHAVAPIPTLPWKPPFPPMPPVAPLPPMPPSPPELDQVAEPLKGSETVIEAPLPPVPPGPPLPPAPASPPLLPEPESPPVPT
jgi:hypothetical protein